MSEEKTQSEFALITEIIKGDKFKYEYFDAAGAVAFRDSKDPDEHYTQFIRDSSFYTKIRSNNPT